MQIVFDRGRLRLLADSNDPLHAEALDVWRESDEIAQRVIQVLPNEAEMLCNTLAETSTRALTLGRDPAVIRRFLDIERRLLDAEELQRANALDAVLQISVIVFFLGLLLGFIWIWVKGIALWTSLPRGFDLAANWILLTAGWSGFTMVGFAFGWMFFQVAVLRVAQPIQLAKHIRLVQQIRGNVLYITLLCFTLTFFLFFFNGFEMITEALSTQLTSSPWAILLGIVAGFVEPSLFDRLKAALRFL